MPEDNDDHRIVCKLDELLKQRGLTLAELSRRMDVSVVNLSVLKNNRGRAIRFTTLTRLCEELQCSPGDLFELQSKSHYQRPLKSELCAK